MLESSCCDRKGLQDALALLKEKVFKQEKSMEVLGKIKIINKYLIVREVKICKG